jgi:hypothetical protein
MYKKDKIVKIMKKLSLVVMSALLMSSAAWADDGFSVNPSTIPQGRTGEVEIVFESAAPIYNRFQLEVQMPEGITCVEVGDELACAKGPLIVSTNHTLTGAHIASKGLERFICVSMTNRAIPEGKGVIMTVTYQADGSLPVGSTLKGYVKNILWNDADNKEYRMDDIEFTVTIGDNRTVLNENSTVVPETASGVDVTVKRTIDAGLWNTICLPFAMSEAQCKAAFGNDVELADFSSWSSEEDDDGNIVSLEIDFTDVTEMEANHPYIIKVSTDMTEFSVDGVAIDAEEEPPVQVGKKKAEKGYFIGTYTTNTVVPEDNLFLNGNKFWYSSGTTQMKGFRGYFELADVLTDVEKSDTRIAMTIDGSPVSVKTIKGNTPSDGVYYDLSGRRTEKPGKGIYIVNGKKYLAQ